MKRIAIALLLMASAVCGAQGIMHGIGAPGALNPPANCALSRFYVDDSTQKLYIAATGSPCLWSDSIAIAGVRSNGTHLASGDGSVVDNGGTPISFPDGTFYPGKSIALFKESSTDPNGEVGVNAVVSYNPAATPDINYVPVGVSSTVYTDGPNLAGIWYFGLSGQVYNNSTTSSPDFLVGTFSGPVSLSSISAGAVLGEYSLPAVEGTGGATHLWGFDADVQNDSDGGAVGDMAGLQVFLSSNPQGLGRANSTTTASGVAVYSPVYAGGSTVTTQAGISIAEQTATGVTTAYQIYSPGTAPSLFAGRMDFQDLVGSGIMTLSQGTSKISTAGGDGWQFSCSDCDTPPAEGDTCTAAGDHAGAQAVAIRGAIKCF